MTVTKENIEEIGEKEHREETKKKRKRIPKKKEGATTDEDTKDPMRVTLADFLKNSSVTSGRPMKAALEREGRKKKKEESDAPVSTPAPTILPPAPQATQNAFFTPQVRVIGDQIVIDEQSVILDVPTADMSSFGIANVTEQPHITSASYSNRASSEKWTSTETDEFYDAIRRYGTDFTLLEKLFAKRTRKQLKSKFKREEKENPRRVDEALKNTIPIDIDHYHTAINQAAEKKKLLEEQKDQSTMQTSQPQPKDDNAWEKPALDTPGAQKTTQQDKTDKSKDVQVDEIEFDEETLANLQDAYYGNFDNYDDDD